MNARLTLASLAAAAAALFATTVASPATAVETYRSGPDTGLHYDAGVVCTGYPYRTISVSPTLATTPGLEWGQTVSIRAFVYDSRGALVGYLKPNDAWTNVRIATKYNRTLGNGVTVSVTDPYVVLGPYQWNKPAGSYTVRVDYAWQTSRGWSYATNVTSSYRNVSYAGGSMRTSNGSRCVID